MCAYQWSLEHTFSIIVYQSGHLPRGFVQDPSISDPSASDPLDGVSTGQRGLLRADLALPDPLDGVSVG